MIENRRFSGIARLYGQAATQRILAANVCIVGVGGVGSWVVEAMARSAIGRITLVDMDHVAESNINRQLPALTDTLGKSKIEVLSERIYQINPECIVTRIDDFVSQDNLQAIISSDFDVVIDCIDNFRIKAAMIALCKRRKQTIITLGGAGGQLDPTRISVSDLRKTEQDPLLAKTRRLLRKEYGFPSNTKRSFGVACVWSDEPQIAAQDSCQTDGSLNCAGFGACMPVTAGFAMAAAGEALKQITQ